MDGHGQHRWCIVFSLFFFHQFSPLRKLWHSNIWTVPAYIRSLNVWVWNVSTILKRIVKFFSKCNAFRAILIVVFFLSSVFRFGFWHLRLQELKLEPCDRKILTFSLSCRRTERRGEFLIIKQKKKFKNELYMCGRPIKMLDHVVKCSFIELNQKKKMNLHFVKFMAFKSILVALNKCE